MTHFPSSVKSSKITLIPRPGPRPRAPSIHGLRAQRIHIIHPLCHVAERPPRGLLPRRARAAINKREDLVDPG